MYNVKGTVCIVPFLVVTVCDTTKLELVGKLMNNE